MDKPIDHQALTQNMQVVIEGLTQNLAAVQTLLSSNVGDDSKRVIRSINKQLEQLTSMNKARAEQVEQLSELVRITTLLTSTLEIDLVLEDVMDTVIDLTEAERAYLVLYDDERELQVRAARNWDHERLTEDEINLSYSVINTALENRKAILTINALEDERFAQQASVLAHKLVSIICIPLLLGGTVVGVLYADNRQKPALFTDEFIPILTAFGTQAAIAIANAHLFGSVKNELQKAKHVIQELSIKIDSDRLHDSVDEIVETDFFRELSDAARQLRKRRKGS